MPKRRFESSAGTRRDLTPAQKWPHVTLPTSPFVELGFPVGTIFWYATLFRFAYKRRRQNLLLATASNELKLPKRNSFIAGFACAFFAMATYYVWNPSDVLGGVHAESPNGLYHCWVMAPLSPAFGGAYEITVIQTKASTVVRRAEVSMLPTEQTVSLRGGGGAVVWDPGNAFVDIHTSGKILIRIWVP
ncbi:hypothetical protein CA13_36900 [Planctomycetes bacterium CA13]|uniref:Uncharacterized protein n=1 Tax=Novipirellula herctigrandis TaxID=2527986 RepID=A0A5C5Z4C3_9BACT|nr:hypothetical protein CA13_36900 [Planctomycetes bacterium CA13]